MPILPFEVILLIQSFSDLPTRFEIARTSFQFWYYGRSSEGRITMYRPISQRPRVPIGSFFMSVELVIVSINFTVAVTEHQLDWYLGGLAVLPRLHTIIINDELQQRYTYRQARSMLMHLETIPNIVDIVVSQQSQNAFIRWLPVSHHTIITDHQ